MNLKDIAIVPTDVYQQFLVLLYADGDHSDVSAVFLGATITNNTDKVVHIKATGKGVPTGDGRRLDVGQSFFYPEFDSRRHYIKTESGAVTSGSVILTGEQQ